MKAREGTSDKNPTIAKMTNRQANPRIVSFYELHILSNNDEWHRRNQKNQKKCALNNDKNYFQP
jgi:hypothetical protein